MNTTAAASPLASRFDPETRARLRGRLLRRGALLATLLGDVLAGKDKTSSLAALGLSRPGARPEELLRDALDQVERRRRLLVGNDDRFGRCDVCGIDLGARALDEVPWADRCAAHASR
jgi:hypothetical protein